MLTFFIQSDVKSSFCSIRTKATLGPDKSLPCILFKAEDELTVPMHSLFQLCFEKGHNPAL